MVPQFQKIFITTEAQKYCKCIFQCFSAFCGRLKAAQQRSSYSDN